MFILQAVLTAAAKIAGASTVAQITAGVGLTVATVTGAGAAGVLPTPVQDGVAHAVEAVTPFNLPDSSDGAGPVRHEAPESEPAEVPTAPPTAAVAEVEDAAHETGDDAAVPAPATQEAEEAEEAQKRAATVTEKAQRADKAAEKAQERAGKAAEKAARTHAEDATETEHEEAEHTTASSTATSGEQESEHDGGHSAPAPSGSDSSGSGTSGSGSGSGGHHGGDD